MRSVPCAIGTFTKRPVETQYVSEPDPEGFGNDPNPTQPPATWSSLSKNWLRSRFHFNFAEWQQGPPTFGVMRVMNDDLVQPNRMFGLHPHREMEIATYVVEGSLSHFHRDVKGGTASETLGAGSVQFMSAGLGITHSEGNDSNIPVRFIQIWILPRKQGVTPNYGSVQGDTRTALRTNQWDHLVGDVEDTTSTAPAKIHQDCNIFVADQTPDAVTPLTFTVKPGRQAYVLVITGPVSISTSATNGEILHTYESGATKGPATLVFSQQQAKTNLLIVEMAATA